MAEHLKHAAACLRNKLTLDIPKLPLEFLCLFHDLFIYLIIYSLVDLFISVINYVLHMSLAYS